MTNMVACPVCKGSKVSPYGGINPCMCCSGVGSITEARQKAMDKVREDITKRMKAKGYDTKPFD